MIRRRCKVSWENVKEKNEYFFFSNIYWIPLTIVYTEKLTIKGSLAHEPDNSVQTIDRVSVYPITVSFDPRGLIRVLLLVFFSFNLTVFRDSSHGPRRTGATDTIKVTCGARARCNFSLQNLTGTRTDNTGGTNERCARISIKSKK